MAEKLKVKKGDRVIVVTGKDKGKTGDILRVIQKENHVLVQGVNMIQRHTRQTQTTQGGIIAKEAPIDISNVAHVDPKDNKATKIGFKTLEDGRKVRFAKRSGEVIDV